MPCFVQSFLRFSACNSFRQKVGGGHSVCFPMSLPVLFCFAFVFFMTGMLIWVTKNLSIVLIFAPLMIKLFCIMALNSILIKEVQKNLFSFEFFLFSLFPYVCIICYFGVQLLRLCIMSVCSCPVFTPILPAVSLLCWVPLLWRNFIIPCNLTCQFLLLFAQLLKFFSERHCLPTSRSSSISLFSSSS